MTAQSTDDVNIWITTGAPTVVPMTAAPSVGAPSQQTVADASSFVDGDLIYVYDTDWDSLNGTWCSGNASGTTFDALGSNTKGETVTPALGNIDHYEQDDLTKLCLSGISINGTEPNTISVATFCEPTAVISSQVQEAGTVTLEGYVDVSSNDYPALYEAWQVGDERLIRIDLGPDQGWLVARGTISSVNWSVPIDGAISYTFVMTLAEAFKHCF